jgi:hypothetical protein
MRSTVSLTEDMKLRKASAGVEMVVYLDCLDAFRG